jgi:excisionase family DNA binding protein
MKSLLDVKGAAEALAVSPWTIRAYVSSGRLRAIRIGRLVRLEITELERFIVEQKTKADPNREERKGNVNE